MQVGRRCPFEGHLMAQRPVLIEDGPNHSAQKPDAKTETDGQPAPEEHLGGGDICSLEEQPSTDDDKPLD